MPVDLSGMSEEEHHIGMQILECSVHFATVIVPTHLSWKHMVQAGQLRSQSTDTSGFGYDQKAITNVLESKNELYLAQWLDYN